MGYLFLAIALITGSIKGYCGKKTSAYVEKYEDAMFANALRMAFCIIIGFCLVAVKDGVPSLIVEPGVLLITVASGVSTAVFVVTWLVTVKKGAYMMLDVFCMIGIIIPLIGGMILYNETVRPIQWLGIALLLCAACIMCSYNNSIKTAMTLSSALLLIICGAANGFTDFSQKMFVKQAGGTPISVFNFYTYAVAALILFVCYAVCSIRKKNTAKPGEDQGKLQIKPILVYVLIMSVCLFFSSYFKTAAANYLPAPELYPLYQGLALVLSTLMATFLFRERLTVKCVAGIFLSFIALILINLL